MIYYFSLFILIFLLAIPNYIKNYKFPSKWFELFVFTLLIFFAGFRYNVGGDWENYISQFKGFSTFGFPSVAIFTSSDPFYITINVLSYKFGGNLIGVNFFCSAVFFISYYSYLKKYENTLFGIIVSFLFIIVILSLGFTRQCLAMGFMLLFLESSYKKNYYGQVIFIFFALASHKSSLIFFVFYGISIVANELENLIRRKNFFFRYKYYLISILLVFLTAIVVFLARDIERFIGVYFSFDREVHISVHQTRTSSGVIYKYPLLLFFSFWYLMTRKNIKFLNKFEKYTFDTFLIFTLSLLPIIGFFSLFVDRAIIYCYPFISIFLCKYINEVIEKKYKFKFFLLCSIFSFIILFVWLKFANHAHHWVPYRNYLFLDN
jgi:hypothetical protein